jgi:polyhydroxybutyrate depolymerase
MLSFGCSVRSGASPRFEPGRERANRRRRNFATAVGTMAFCLVACLLPDPASASARLTMKSGGEIRSAVIVEHEALKLRRRPLVIVLRPRGGAGPKRHRLAFQEIVESRKPVFIYPEPSSAGWPVAAGPDADRETTFLRDLINRFVGEGVGDPRKIFLVGESSGGVFAYRAACAGLGRPVAGIATLGAAMPADLAQCDFAPMAFIAVNNLGNPNIPFAGGPATIGVASFEALPAESTLSIFASRAGCGPKREESPLSERDAHGVNHVRGAVLSYPGCKAPVEEVRLGTAPPHGPAQKPPRPAVAPSEEGRDFDAARKVWNFLKRNGA